MGCDRCFALAGFNATWRVPAVSDSTGEAGGRLQPRVHPTHAAGRCSRSSDRCLGGSRSAVWDMLFVMCRVPCWVSTRTHRMVWVGRDL